MDRIRIGNAPVSWGIFEAGFGRFKQKPYEEVLDEIKRAGYEGSELGPYGYFPTEPHILSKVLKEKRLKLASSFVPLPLEEDEKIEESLKEALKVGSLLKSQGVQEIIIADDVNTERAKIAGFVPSDGSKGWNEKDWLKVEKTLNKLSKKIESELQMKIVVHHHAGTFIETPSEIEKLLSITDPDNVGLLLDTGHYVYGGGNPVEGLKKLMERIRYIHFKDILIDKLNEVRKNKIDMHRAWKMGVFCELGKGCVDFKKIVEILKKTNYSGWIIVEQDIIPQKDGSLFPLSFECAKKSREYLKSLGI